MIVELLPSGLRSSGTVSLGAASGEQLLYPSDLAELLGDTGGLSLEDAERRCFLRRVPCVRVSARRATVCADYMGLRHLYLHERRDPDGAALMVTDDPFAFRGRLEPDLEVLRLVPALKFAPLPLSCVRGTVRMMPGSIRTYALGPLALEAERSLLPGELRDTQADTDVARVLREIVRELGGGDPAHVFLSGGMDSALITHLVRNEGRGVQAWTARFDSALGHVEAERATASARHLGAQIEVVDVDGRGRAELTTILDAMREPFADVATVAEATLARRAAEGGARLVFEGEGVDSLMCGSYKFVVEHYRGYLAALTALVPDAFLAGAARRTAWGRLRLKVGQMKALAGARGTPFERHLGFLADPRAWSAVSPAMREAAAAAFRGYYDLQPEAEGMNRLAAMTFWGNIPNLENRKLDLVERHSGIRFLLPFQDLRFVAAALATPSVRKVGYGYGKWSMRRAFRGHLPPHTLTRKKLSFVPNVLELLGPEHEATLLDSSLFPADETARMLREHRAGTADHLPALWAILVTHHWLARFRG